MPERRREQRRAFRTGRFRDREFQAAFDPDGGVHGDPEAGLPSDARTVILDAQRPDQWPTELLQRQLHGWLCRRSRHFDMRAVGQLDNAIRQLQTCW